jgi:hypothetical protein
VKSSTLRLTGIILPSWNMFIHRDFHPYEIPEQLRDYGLDFLRLLLTEFHFIGFGTFFPREAENKENLRKQDRRGIGWLPC